MAFLFFINNKSTIKSYLTFKSYWVQRLLQNRNDPGSLTDSRNREREWRLLNQLSLEEMYRSDGMQANSHWLAEQELDILSCRLTRVWTLITPHEKKFRLGTYMSCKCTLYVLYWMIHSCMLHFLFLFIWPHNQGWF